VSSGGRLQRRQLQRSAREGTPSVCTKRTVPCCLPCLSKSHDACRLAAQRWGRLTPQHGNALCIGSGAYALLQIACMKAGDIQGILHVSVFTICRGNVKTCPIHINSTTV
jgi:hypothetical protein